jgi:hypothetical protein
MKRFIIGFIFCLFLNFSLDAQVYKVSTEQPDPFSQALVNLMNCGLQDFRDCKGDSLRSTSLEGDEYRLTINFPGSKAGIVRFRDWSRTAWIEFGNYSDTRSLATGIREITAMISKALGTQLNISHDLLTGPDSSFFIASMGIKNEQGNFRPNIELMSGSNPASHLIQNNENSDHYFILMKLEGGIPEFFYSVKPVTPPNQNLHQTLQELLKAASTDFDTLNSADTTGIGVKKKNIGKIILNGRSVILNQIGGNHFAAIHIPYADSFSINDEWVYCQQAVQAAIGPSYSYHLSEDEGRPFIVYFSNRSDESKPVIYLKQDLSTSSIVIQVTSNFHHPVKRGLDMRE